MDEKSLQLTCGLRASIFILFFLNHSIYRPTLIKLLINFSSRIKTHNLGDLLLSYVTPIANPSVLMGSVLFHQVVSHAILNSQNLMIFLHNKAPLLYCKIFF